MSAGDIIAEPLANTAKGGWFGVKTGTVVGLVIGASLLGLGGFALAGFATWGILAAVGGHVAAGGMTAFLASHAVATAGVVGSLAGLITGAIGGVYGGVSGAFTGGSYGLIGGAFVGAAKGVKAGMETLVGLDKAPKKEELQEALQHQEELLNEKQRRIDELKLARAASIGENNDAKTGHVAAAAANSAEKSAQSSRTAGA